MDDKKIKIELKEEDLEKVAGGSYAAAEYNEYKEDLEEITRNFNRFSYEVGDSVNYTK